jgi:dTDP-4-amino-4,6-dideoxygalactose transaminase
MAMTKPVVVSQDRLRFIRPTVPPLEEVMELYAGAYSEGMLTNSSLVARLEAVVCERLGVKHCVAVSSCTSGLMLVLRALDLRGEVILPSFTFFVTGQAVLWNGLRPVFADCDPATWNINPADVAARIGPDTCAVLAVHLYGNPAPVAELEALCARHGLKLVFDAAHGFGSRVNGQPVGRFGDAEVFSLTPTKLLVAGEGGLVCTNDQTLARRVRVGRNYGDAGSYDPELLGLNARMTEFNAAVALAGLDSVEAKVARRNAIARRYTELLSTLPGVSFQQVPAGSRSAYKDFSVLIAPEDFGATRDDVAQALINQNIETRKYFHPPLHRQRLFRELAAGPPARLPNTERISSQVLSLPVYESLTDPDVCRVAEAIRKCARL